MGHKWGAVFIMRDNISEQRALLLLEDGNYFVGTGFGFTNRITLKERVVTALEPDRLCGELCFNTGMSGYQEVLSDPSYAGQMICFSFPHIGNVGANAQDYECPRPHALGLICREYPTEPSNWRSELGLISWLKQHRISGICGMDTRALVHHLRERGSLRALLGTFAPEDFLQRGDTGNIRAEVLQLLLAQLRRSPEMTGRNLSPEVNGAQSGNYDKPVLEQWLPLQTAHYVGRDGPGNSAVRRELHVVVLDFGIKANILQSLCRFATKVSVLPLPAAPADSVTKEMWQDIVCLRPDGLFLSNGPGDPQPVFEQVDGVLQEAFSVKLPVFGICLGHQILALSLGAKTLHMHHGHRGINHPVWNMQRNALEITSQNHGFCVAEEGLSESLEVTHRSLFDSSIEGIRSREIPAFSVQYHPESSPGPHESQYLFCDFTSLMEKHPNVF